MKSIQLLAQPPRKPGLMLLNIKGKGIEMDVTVVKWVVKTFCLLFLARFPINGKIKTTDQKVNWYVSPTVPCVSIVVL